jgi:hypothetical protein
MGSVALQYCNSNVMPEIFLAYQPDNSVLPPGVPARLPLRRRSEHDEVVETVPVQLRSTGNRTLESFTRRGLHDYVTDSWYLAQISWPPGYNFDEDQPPLYYPAKGNYAVFYDDSYGTGQTIYVAEIGLDQTNAVSLSFFNCK